MAKSEKDFYLRQILTREYTKLKAINYKFFTTAFLDEEFQPFIKEWMTANYNESDYEMISFFNFFLIKHNIVDLELHLRLSFDHENRK